MPFRRRLGRAVLATLTTVLVVLAGPAAEAASTDPTTTPVRSQDARVAVGAEPDGTAVTLDTTTFVPAGAGPHPAVLLAHGFGGSKKDLVDRAEVLAGKGYLVLTWTARGFGDSGGRIHLDDPAYEGADVRALVDVLAGRGDVILDGPGDPRVAVVGGSYGGAIGLIGAALDRRIDTVVAAITWNDLSGALFPQGAVGANLPGPIKQTWVSRFFATSVAQGGQAGESPGAAVADGAVGPSGAGPSGAAGTSGAAPSGAAGTSGAGPSGAAGQPGASGGLLCGRFDPTVCRLLMSAAESGAPSPELLAMLRKHSPAPLLTDLRAPVLLIQGMSDSLFGLDQADATAHALLAQGTQVAVRWIDGGHDGPSTTAAQDDEAVDTWLAHYVADPPGRSAHTEGSGLPLPAFTYAGVLARRETVAPLFSHPTYPGTSASAPREVSTLGFEPSRRQSVLTPPGGEPASVTTVPGLGGLAASLPTYQLAALPGQSAAYDTRPLSRSLSVVGAPRVTLRVTSTGPEVTLFASLWQVQGQVAGQPRRLVVPVRVATKPGVPTEVTIDLPAATWQMAAGSTWRLLVTSTDSAFANARQARADRLEVVGGLALPTLAGTPLAGPEQTDTESIGVGVAIVAVLLAVGVLWLRDRRRLATLHPAPDLVDVPLVVSHLVKTYADGHRAVDDVSWRAEKGQVVGLLGPNGAGKTTTIRMVLGLITPDSGTVHVLGDPVSAGAPVLGRVGALVEGPGFLPHLTGRQNLEAYWRATGRPVAEAGFDEALSVAALGGALDRPVRTYSHGMKQRLGIAQAMLGLPELLILDEPTNGLDPPQIAAMRPILHAYAAAGRTVVISSHLLAEVEQTCSHVVVMHAGRVVTAGAVSDLVASEDTTVLELGSAGTPTPRVAEVLRETRGIRTVDVEDGGAHGRVTVVADRPRGEVVRAALDAGGDVVGVGSRRHLEEVFLGVIAQASHEDTRPTSGGSLIERLRQVRAR